MKDKETRERVHILADNLRLLFSKFCDLELDISKCKQSDLNLCLKPCPNCQRETLMYSGLYIRGELEDSREVFSCVTCGKRFTFENKEIGTEFTEK